MRPDRMNVASEFPHHPRQYRSASICQSVFGAVQLMYAFYYLKNTAKLKAGRHIISLISSRKPRFRLGARFLWGLPGSRIDELASLVVELGLLEAERFPPHDTSFFQRLGFGLRRSYWEPECHLSAPGGIVR